MLTISSIDTPQKKSNLRRVYFSETGEYEKIPQQVVRLHDLSVGMSFNSLEEFHALVSNDQYNLAKERALRILARSEKTTHEVSKKLKEDGYFETTISEVISFLEEYKLCDDADFASRYVQQQLSMGLPPQKIKFKLSQRGISRDLICELLDNLQSEESQSALFEKGTKLIEKFDLSTRKEFEKALRKLVGRGYSFDEAKRIINSQQDRG